MEGKLTEIELGIDIKKASEDGETFDLKDFTEERFDQALLNAITDSDAGELSYTLSDFSIREEKIKEPLKLIAYADGRIKFEGWEDWFIHSYIAMLDYQNPKLDPCDRKTRLQLFQQADKIVKDPDRQQEIKIVIKQSFWKSFPKAVFNWEN